MYFYLTVPANVWKYNYDKQIKFASSWDNTSCYHKELINFSELWPFTLDIVQIDIMGSTHKTDFFLNGIRPCCTIYQSVELNANKNVNGSYELYNNYSYCYGNALENRLR